MKYNFQSNNEGNNLTSEEFTIMNKSIQNVLQYQYSAIRHTNK